MSSATAVTRHLSVQSDRMTARTYRAGKWAPKVFTRTSGSEIRRWSLDRWWQRGRAVWVKGIVSYCSFGDTQRRTVHTLKWYKGFILHTPGTRGAINAAVIHHQKHSTGGGVQSFTNRNNPAFVWKCRQKRPEPQINRCESQAIVQNLLKTHEWVTLLLRFTGSFNTMNKSTRFSPKHNTNKPQLLLLIYFSSRWK